MYNVVRQQLGYPPAALPRGFGRLESIAVILAPLIRVSTPVTSELN
jgi:hypothetical protein